MRPFFAAILLFAFSAVFACAADPSRVLPEGETSKDARLGPLRTLNDKYHPWEPPATKEP